MIRSDSQWPDGNHRTRLHFPKAVENGYTGSLELAYTRGLIDGSLIRAAAGRILALKEWLAGQTQPELDVVGCEAHQKLARRVAEQALTLVRDVDHLIPLKPGHLIGSP